MSWLLAPLLAIAACAVLYFFALPRRRKLGERDLRAELRRLTHDADVADRLIERMRRKHPDASETALLRLAIAELRADRRR